MTKIKKVLAPTDLSKLSRPALRYALELAAEQSATVIAYHVISEDSSWIGSDDRCAARARVAANDAYGRTCALGTGAVGAAIAPRFLA